MRVLVLAALALLVQLSSALVIGVTMKTALVTGATDGIGRHTATRLAQDGWRVLVHGRNPSRIEESVKMIKLKAPGAEVEAYRADFANLDDVRRLGNEVLANHPTLDLLINNAGVYEESMQTTKDGREFVFQVLPVDLGMNTLQSTQAQCRR
jgi:NAD(P)-dependent dehydrogenase (short-subunit alcohol dehydrogenase family)